MLGALEAAGYRVKSAGREQGERPSDGRWEVRGDLFEVRPSNPGKRGPPAPVVDTVVHGTKGWKAEVLDAVARTLEKAHLARQSDESKPSNPASRGAADGVARAPAALDGALRSLVAHADAARTSLQDRDEAVRARLRPSARGSPVRRCRSSSPPRACPSGAAPTSTFASRSARPGRSRASWSASSARCSRAAGRATAACMPSRQQGPHRQGDRSELRRRD